MKQSAEVLVIGGGVVGLASALAMAQRGFTTTLIDAGALDRPKSLINSRVYAINQASQDLLETLKVWSELEKTRISSYRRMLVWDAASGAEIEFDATMIAASHLGTIIEESVLKAALWNVIEQQTNINLCPNQTIVAIEQLAEGIVVRSAKQSWQTKLLMIADGANSRCRQLLQVPLTSWSYRQQALVATVMTEKSHQQTAYQVFHAEGPLAFLPLNDEKQCSIVWSTSLELANRLSSLSDVAFNEQLTTAFAGKLGEVFVQGKRYQFPLIMNHVKQYSGKHWLLLGDAAHTIHPLAGLGLNVGLADLAAWLSLCVKKDQAKVSSSVLQAYQRQRKHTVWQVVVMMEVLKNLFGSSFTPLVKLRSLGLQFSNHFLFLKRFFIEQAAGKKIDF